jgi:lysophospholipase L1-like esterase
MVTWTKFRSFRPNDVGVQAAGQVPGFADPGAQWSIVAASSIPGVPNATIDLTTTLPNVLMYSGGTSGTGWVDRYIKDLTQTCVNQRMEMRFWGAGQIYAFMRAFGASSSTLNAFAIKQDSEFYAVNAGNLGGSTGSGSLSGGGRYWFDFAVEIIQTDANTTTINTYYWSTDVPTASGAQPAFGSGTLLGTNTSTWTGTDGPAQGNAGNIGVFFYNPGSPPLISQWDFYSGDAPTVATGFTLTGPNTAIAGQPQTYTLTPNGPVAAQTIATIATSNGTTSVSSLTFAANATAGQTFTRTPAAAGTHTLSITNDQGLTNPAVLTITDSAAPSPATTFTLSAPSTGSIGTAQTLTVTPDGIIGSSPVHVIVSASPDGTLSATSLTFAASATAAQTLTYTPASAGAKTLSITNDGGLTNSSPITDTISSRPAGFIAVSDAACQISPFNWKGDTGRGGSVYRQTWNAGAWIKFKWTASGSPTAQLQIGGPSNTSVIYSYFINGKLYSALQASNGNLTIATGDLYASATNLLEVFMSTSNQEQRWGGINQMQVFGLQLDAASTPLAITPYAKRAKINGDSITEGIQAGLGGGSDNIFDTSHYAVRALELLGYGTGVSACGFSGILAAGDGTGDVLPYCTVIGGTYDDTRSRWNKIDAGVSLLDSNGHISAFGGTGQEPDLILNDYGVNDTGANQTDLQASIVKMLTLERAAAPNAWMIHLMPYGFGYVPLFGDNHTHATIIAAYAQYQTQFPLDTKIGIVDLGSDVAYRVMQGIYASGLHPSLYGHAQIASMVMAKLIQMITQNVIASVPTYAGGFHP